MYRFEIKKTTTATIFLFIFLLIANSFTLSANSIKTYKTLLESGERFLSEGEYEKAEEEFLRVAPLIKDNKTLAILYQLLSLVYFKKGNMERCEGSLREMFERDPRKKINTREYENEYVIIYNKIRAEYWFKIKTVSEEDEASEKKIIEKLAHKPKKKKSKLLRILTLVGIVVISGVLVAVLFAFTREKEPIKNILWGKVTITNLTTYTVWFSVLEIQDILHSGERKSYMLPDGTHTITFFDDTHSQTRLVRVLTDGFTSIDFTGWEDSTEVYPQRK